MSLNIPIMKHRDEYNQQFGDGTGPLILARTDSLKTDGFEAAIERCLAFREVGCDMTFLEAPESIEQMKEYCSRVDGAKLANVSQLVADWWILRSALNLLFYSDSYNDSYSAQSQDARARIYTRATATRVEENGLYHGCISLNASLCIHKGNDGIT